MRWVPGVLGALCFIGGVAVVVTFVATYSPHGVGLEEATDRAVSSVFSLWAMAALFFAFAAICDGLARIRTEIEHFHKGFLDRTDELNSTLRRLAPPRDSSGPERAAAGEKPSAGGAQ